MTQMLQTGAVNQRVKLPLRRWPLSPVITTYWVLSLLLLSLIVMALAKGAIALSIADLSRVIATLFETDAAAIDSATSLNRYVILELRLPRIITACVVGAGLAAAGVCLQGLFRNPLADPSLIGVSSGASLGAVSVIVLASSLPFTPLPSYILLPIAAFAGGMIATVIVYNIATRYGYSNIHLLLLAGIAVNAMAGAGVGLLSYIASDNQLRDLTFWSMGSVAKSGWKELAIALPIMLFSSWRLLRYRTALDSLLMGEAVARHIGHDVTRIKRGVIIYATLIVGTAVSLSGIIMFVGLVVPHLVRLTLGAGHKNLLPVSMLAGASVLIAGDLVARLAIAPAELPIGLLMSLAGGPFFIGLLLRQRNASH